MNIITNDATNKCVKFARATTPQTSDTMTVFKDMVVAIGAVKSSKTAAAYAANDFDLKSRVRIISNDTDTTYKGNAIVELDLYKEDWALSGTPTVKLTDPETVKDTLLGYFATGHV